MTSLIFDIFGNDHGASRAFRQVGDEADDAGRRLRSMGKDADSTSSPFDTLTGKLALIGGAAHGLKVLLTPSVFAELIPPAIGAAAALVQASQALLILPGAAASAGVAVGALALATMGFGDALKNMDDPEKFAEALKNLSPSAQQAATSIKGLVDGPIKDLRMALQERLFANLGPQITSTANTLISVFRPAFESIASTANKTLSGILKDLQSTRDKADLSTIASSSSRAFSNLAAAVRPLIQAFLDIAAVGSKVFADLTGGAGGLAQKFADFISRIKESGALEEMMRQGIDTIKQLGRIVGDVFSAIMSIFHAAAADGQTFLDSLERMTQGFADFAKSVPGQEMFKAFFSVLSGMQSAFMELTTLAPAVTVVLKAIAEALNIISPMLQPFVALIGQIAITLAPLIPLAGQVGAALIQGLTTVLQTLMPLIEGLVAGVQGFVTNALPGFNTGVSSAAAAFGPLLSSLGELVRTILPPLGTALGYIAEVIGPYAPLILTIVAAVKTYSMAVTAVTAVQTMWNVAMLANPAGIVIAGLVAIGVAIYALVQNWDTIKSAAGAAYDFISTRAAVTVNYIYSVFSGIGAFFAGIWNSVYSGAASAWYSITTVISNTINWIKSAGSNAASWLYNAGIEVVKGLWSGISAAGSWLWNQLWNWIKSVVPDPILQALGIASESKWARWAGKQVPLGLASGVEATTPAAVSATANLVQRVQDAVPATLASTAVGATAGAQLGLAASGVPVLAPGMLSPATTPGGLSQIVLRIESSGNGGFDDFLAEAIRKYVRVVGGGNVQTAYKQTW